jgi:hypothetical protein
MFAPKTNTQQTNPKNNLFGANNHEFIQPKLNVGKPGDKYEVEADKAADQIVAKSKQPESTFLSPTPSVQKQSEEDVQKQESENEIQQKPVVDPITPGVQLKSLTQLQSEEEIQSKEEEDIQEKEDDQEIQKQSSGSGGKDTSGIEQQLNASKGGGSPLDTETRSEMESGFGSDFSGVRVHNDSNAVQMNQELGAQAFTNGNDIYFNEGKYNPSSDSGKHLLAHELTHTVQQGASPSVQSKLIQKADDTPAPAADPAAAAAPSNEYTFTDATNGGEFKINTSNKTATVPTIGVPRFKVPFGPSTTFNLPQGGAEREGTHMAAWENAAQSGSGFTSSFNEKIAAETPPPLADGGAPVYYLVLKGGSARETRGNTDGDAGVIFGTPDAIKLRISRPYWDSSGKYVPHDVDHKRELQLGGDETNTDNLWMLEASANRSSGSLISGERRSKITALLSGSREHLITPPDYDTVKNTYTITVQNGVSAGQGMTLNSSANPDQYWSLANVQDGRHLSGLKFLSEAEIEAAGLRGSPNELVFYTGRSGGRAIRIPWDDAARAAGRKDGLSIYVGRRGGANLIINSVVYRSSSGGEGQGGTGSLICTAFPGSRGVIKEQTNLALPTEAMPGVAYGGYITRPSVLQAVLHAMELRHMSPITFNDAGIDQEAGLVGTGKVAPTIPLIRDADIDIIIDADGVKVRKLFSSGEFDFPAPFEIHNTSLEVFVSSADGFGINGRIDFGINNVGDGFIGAAASTGGGFELEGEFNFDSKLFDPATIRAEYKDNIWTIGGEIGIPEGKVRGVKNATITAQYSENNFTATGKAELDIPGIQRGGMEINYGEGGFSISGDFDLSPDIPGIKSGRVSARVAKQEGQEDYDVMVTGTAQPDVPGINSSLTVTYENGALTIEGTAQYSRGMLSGEVTVGATNRAIGDDGNPSGEPDDNMRVYGGGTLTLQLTPWLAATAGVKFLPNGEIEVTARLDAPYYEVFARQEINKNLFTVPTIEIPLFAIPLGPRSIGLVAQIGGGLDFTAGFGPGQLRNLSAEITYNPEREDETTVNGHGEFAIPADAGLTLRGDVSVGASVVIASITGGIELAGTLGLAGEALASVDVNWSPQTGLEINAMGSILVSPKFTFDINAFIRGTLGIGWLSVSETWRKNLVSYEWGSGIEFGIKFPVNYKEGEPFSMSFDDIEVVYPELDIPQTAKSIATDVKDEIF